MMKEHIEVEWKSGLIMRGYHKRANSDTVVIVVHGIGGNKLGHKYIFKQYADVLAENEISSIRVDFIGSGESDGEFDQTMHSTQVSQVAKLVEFAKKIGYKNVVLSSTTIGCYPLWHYAKQDESIRLIINWNPITDFKKYKKDQLVAEQNGIIDMHGLYLSNKYVDDLKSLDEIIPELSCDITMIQGEDDYEFQTKDCQNVAAQREWNYIPIPGANHLFEGNEARKSLFLSSVNSIKETI